MQGLKPGLNSGSFTRSSRSGFVVPLTLTCACHSECIIKKSRFIGCVQPVQDRTEALAVVAELRVAHPGAAHVCWALMAGGQSAAVDDGEPSGTAGRPMLDVLRHQQLEGVLATVVRYFGGVKLGAGGLVRAYTDAVAQALLDAERQPIIRRVSLRCEVPYASEGLLRRLADDVGAVLDSSDHGEAVQMVFSMPADTASAFRAGVTEATQGRVFWFGDVD